MTWVSTTRRLPTRSETRARGPTRTFDSPRAGPTARDSVVRAGRPGASVRTPSAPAPEGNSDTRSPGRPARSAVAGPAPAWSSRIRVVASRRTTSRPTSAGSASSHTFASAWSKRGPPSAPRTVIRVAPRASAASTASSRSDSSLAAAASSTGIPAARTSANPAVPSESASPTTRSGRSPRPSPASRRRRPRSPARRRRPSPASRRRARPATARRRRRRGSRAGRRGCSRNRNASARMGRRRRFGLPSPA